MMARTHSFGIGPASGRKNFFESEAAARNICSRTKLLRKCSFLSPQGHAVTMMV
jgi:hypothetical protein